jgi:hypothetical protein
MDTEIDAIDYTAPLLVEVGTLTALTLGTASDDNSDDNDGSSYWDKK